MSLQKTDILDKIQNAYESGKTPELVFYAKWIKKYQEKNEKFDDKNINDYLVSNQLLQTHKTDYSDKVQNLYNNIKSWLINEYNYEVKINPEDNSGLWTKNKFNEKIYNINGKIAKLKEDNNENLFKSCSDDIEELNKYLNSSECPSCPENCNCISENNCPKQKIEELEKKCDFIRFVHDLKDINNMGLEHLLNLKDALCQIEEKNKPINENEFKYFYYYKSKLFEKIADLYVDNISKAFIESENTDFSSIISNIEKDLEEIEQMKINLSKDTCSEKSSINSLEKDIGLLKKALTIKDRDSKAFENYKKKVVRIKEWLKEEPAYDNLDKVITNVKDLLENWKEYTNLKNKNKGCNKRNYERKILEKLENIKQEADKISNETPEEDYSEELNIFGEKIEVKILVNNDKGLANTIMNFIYKLLPSLKKK